MEDANFFTKEGQLGTEKNPQNPTKFYTHFLQKALIVTIFFVILPLFPSQAPEFINQTLLNRGWELLHLLLVGIAVSYGLFSRRNDETEKDNHNNVSKSDNAQSYVSRLLQFSSVFDDDAENVAGSDENKVVQAWNSQYYRNEPPVVVAANPSVLDERGSSGSGVAEKPLLLPVRSLKSRVLDADETSKEPVNPRSVSRSNSNLGSKRVLNKPRNGDLGGLDHGNLEEKVDENVVLPSPIPWRSRSGRMEVKEQTESPPKHTLPPAMEEFDFNRVESRSFRSRSSRSNSTSSPKFSTSPSMSSPRKLSPAPSLSAEQAKSLEDSVKKKSFYRAPPPPPPPPLPTFKASSFKPSSRLSDSEVFFEKELHRSFRSEPKDLNRNGEETLMDTVNSGYGGKSKTIRSINSLTGTQQVRETEQLSRESFTFMPRPTYVEYPREEKRQFIENMTLESETDEDSDTEKEEDEEVAAPSSGMDATSDVDKKADEFIAKIREQIRLQRIDSIKRSSGQTRRNPSR
ncbi:hypothetical protein SLEP1_g8938 [Rubroshorea leprosula]|uniref:Uncharacterized protein n=1 Tax=Rubroshorea leprosula TaxID=152421 RepID=A0AAV5I3B8_9ROSI|nr:hypothetical protein SLEP1_g8938 [Rubroshorea leprosula]